MNKLKKIHRGDTVIFDAKSFTTVDEVVNAAIKFTKNFKGKIIICFNDQLTLVRPKDQASSVRKRLGA